MKTLRAVAVVLAFASSSIGAQQKTMGAAVTESFTIEAIDHSSRIVTLKDKNGALSDVVCGPEVQRFDALKVGDNVTMRYYESLVSAIRATTAAPKPPVQASVTRTPGDKPGGTIAQQFTATVTIVAIDMKVPSVTIKRSDGRTLSFKVEDKKNLEGFKAGDTVEITYTQALAISVTPAK